MNAGLAGGTYFKTETILDAFADEAVARLDWEKLGLANKAIYSSDFAMPYVLAARGWDVKPWPEVAQMEQNTTVPWTGAANAAFRHYSRGYPGGKPAYRRGVTKEDEKLF